MSILSDVLGKVLGGGDPTGGQDAKMDAILQEIMQNAQNVSVPQINPLDYERLQSQGDFTPETYGDPRLMDLASQSDTRLSGVSVDPRLAGTEDKTLQALEDIVNQGGLQAQDKARMDTILDQVSTQARGRNEAIQQNMAAKGMGGSGMDLIAQLQNSQGATDRAQSAGLDVAGQANQRAMDAILNQGSFANTLANRDLGLQTKQATAQDAINRFNTQIGADINRQNTNSLNQVGQGNVDLRNQASQVNLQNRQRIADQNVGLSNIQQDVNKMQIPQQQFENQMRKQQGVQQALGGQLDVSQNRGASNAAQKGMLESIVGGATTGGQVGGPYGAIAGGVLGASSAHNRRKR